MKNSTLNLYELADIKTISVYHGLIQFSCFEKLEILERNIVDYKNFIFSSH